MKIGEFGEPAVTPQQIWRIRRRDQNKCERCGKPNADMRFYYCLPCRDRTNAQRRAMRAISRRVSAVVCALLLSALPAAAQGPLELGGAGPSSWPRQPTQLRIIDGTWNEPLTGQTDRTPTVYIERNDASNIEDGVPNPTMQALEVLYLTKGRSPYWGGFTAGTFSQYTTAVGKTYPYDASTHNGSFSVSVLLPESHNAFAIGATNYAWIFPGEGPARATGTEIDLVNDRRPYDPAAPNLDMWTIGAAVINGGLHRSRSAVEILSMGPTNRAAGGDGGWYYGIYMRDVVRGSAGLVFEDWQSDTVPGILFWTASHHQGYITQYGDAIGIGEHGKDPVLYVNVATGELQVRTPEGEMRPVLFGQPDHTGFRPMGVR